MKPQGVRIKPIGGMDSDSELLSVNNMRYLDALNVRQVTRDGQTMYAVENMVGNELLFSIPDVNPVQKRYEIYIDQTNLGSATETWIFELYTSNGVKLGSLTSSFVIDGFFFANTLTNLTTAFNTLMASLGYSATVSSGIYANGGQYFQFSIGNLGYSDYKLYLIKPATSVVTAKAYCIQEALPPSATKLGFLRPIAFREINGDVFVWSTTQDDKPLLVNATLTNATNATPIVLTWDAPHGIIDGEKIKISGVIGNTAANGVFTATLISPTQVSLQNSAGNGVFAPLGTEKVYYNNEGVGEIGVVTFDVNTETTTYTRLCRSKQWNFVSMHQIDIHGEDNVFRKTFYWCDFYNIDRCWYYQGAYRLNGSIYHPFNNPTGLYEYETIGLETQLTISNVSVDFKFERINDAGGKLPSGNIVYWVKFINDGGSSTDYIGPINPINIYKAIANDNNSNIEARKVVGDKALVETTKSVTLLIDNIPNVFQYFQIAYGYPSGKGTFLKTGLLPKTLIQEQTTIEFTHTGLEAEEDFDIGTINRINSVYVKSQNIRALDQRLVKSNTTTEATYDFSGFFATFKHSIKLHKMESIHQTNLGTTFEQYRVREYMLPENVNGKVGYMLLERYRFFGQVEFYSGAKSDWFYLDDIIFDNNTYSRRVGTLPNLDLAGYPSGSSANPDHYVPCVEFHGFNLDYIVDGIPVRQLVKKIHIGRCEVDNPTVFGHGLSVPCVSGQLTSTSGLEDYFASYNYPNILDRTTFVYGEFPFVHWNNLWGGWLNGAGTYNGYPTAGNAVTAPFTAQRRYASFYCFDRMYKQTPWEVLPGDKLLNFGQGEVNRTGQILSSETGSVGAGNAYNQFVYLKHTDRYTANLTASKINILEGKDLRAGDSVVLNSQTFAKQYAVNARVALQESSNIYNRPDSLMLYLSTDLAFYGLGIDRGIYFSAYYRERTAFAQYGTPASNKVVPTEATFNVQTSNYTVIPDVSGVFNEGIFRVFGGDTFTHTAALRLNIAARSVNSSGADIAINRWGAAGVFYTTQSKVNILMRGVADDGSKPFQNYPSLKEYVEDGKREETLVYNAGYTPKNTFNIIKKPAYDPNAIKIASQPTMVAYSEKKFIGSAVDGYRTFLPLNFALLDYSNGAVNGMEVANGNLYTWQDRAFNKHYFNSDGMFITADGAEVITGSGGVLNRKEADLSYFGAINKWGIFRGRSIGGKDVLYWFSGVFRLLIRHGDDGTVVLSERNYQHSTIDENTKWASLYDNPVLKKGVYGYWHQKFMEATWHFRGRKQVPVWDAVTGYSEGEEVYISFGPDDEGIYISKQDTNINHEPLSGVSDDWWEFIPLTNTDYYSNISIVYNEKSNVFSHRRGQFIGLTSTQNEELILASPFDGSKSQILKDDSGTDLTWFNIPEQGFIEMIVNIYPEETKIWKAIYLNCKRAPFRIEFRTENHYSYLVAADFELREDGYWSPIKNHAPVNQDGSEGSNAGDTSQLWGKYLKIKVFFQPGERQVLRGAVIKFLVQPRTTEQ